MAASPPQQSTVWDGRWAPRIRKGLSVAAESARSHGDRRGHGQIIADLFTQALLVGEALDPSTVDLGVVITDRSLFAPAHADAALIEGLGAVPYEHIRDAMYEAVCASPDADSALRLRRLYTDPEDGQLVAMDSRARADRSSRATRNKRATRTAATAGPTAGLPPAARIARCLAAAAPCHPR